MKPRVTIAIPMHNRAATLLSGGVKSALAQRYEPLEIAVSDNCSTYSKYNRRPAEATIKLHSCSLRYQS